jgi:pyridoxamine 5'-phosphate oxidase
VRIEGGVTHTSDAESDAYFASRPWLSRIGAWASRQSRAVESGRREGLEIAVAEMLDRFTGPNGEELPVPRPPHWGGYRVAMEAIEFWQGCPFRMHDRVVYTKRTAGGAAAVAGADQWEIRRLFP